MLHIILLETKKRITDTEPKDSDVYAMLYFTPNKKSHRASVNSLCGIILCVLIFCISLFTADYSVNKNAEFHRYVQLLMG